MTQSELNLINQARLLIAANDEILRQCDVCNKYMIDGYWDGDGLSGSDKEYFCSDVCLSSVIALSKWWELYTQNGDSYWTRWGEFTPEA